MGWVDYARGICMIAVVTLYAVKKMKGAGGDAGWLHYWADFAKPFRMPDFFLLSGLFLGRVIDRPWRSYLDKKVCHYLYFFVLWSVIMYAARMVALRLGVFSGDEDAGSLPYKLLEPFAMLWFIQMLAVFFVVTRLLRAVPVWVVLPVAAMLQMVTLPDGLRPTMITHFCERYVFFYAGYRFASLFFSLAAQAQARRGMATLALLGWMCVNEGLVLAGVSEWKGVSLILGLAGAMGVITAGALLQGVRGTAWLSYLGKNSMVVYLAFYLPMQLLVALSRRFSPFMPDPGTLGLLISALSALAALTLFWVTRGTWLGFLFARPAWARIDSSSAKAEPGWNPQGLVPCAAGLPSQRVERDGASDSRDIDELHPAAERRLNTPI